VHVKNWKFYEDELVAIIQRFQAVAPNISVLVISVSDMARKVNGEYVSYETLPAIRIAQKRAAERTGAAFWDLHSAMGGTGAIHAWVAHDPPYAARDFMHFSPSGQLLVAKMLNRELMRQYKRYKQRRDNIAPTENDSLDDLFDSYDIAVPPPVAPGEKRAPKANTKREKADSSAVSEPAAQAEKAIKESPQPETSPTQ
jgi:hypothetical protein